jgi:nucleoid-associated protein YgaU
MFGSPLDTEQAFDTMRAMNRTRVRHRRIAVTISVALVGGAWAGPAMGSVLRRSEPESVTRRAYVVHEGDTLWAIAERVSPGGDPRPVVDALSAANGIAAEHLVPGQVLVVPAGS